MTCIPVHPLRVKLGHDTRGSPLGCGGGGGGQVTLREVALQKVNLSGLTRVFECVIDTMCVDIGMGGDILAFSAQPPAQTRRRIVIQGQERRGRQHCMH